MLNELSRQIYKNNIEKGFYENPVETGTRIALIHSEVSEALEAHRKDKFTLHGRVAVCNEIDDQSVFVSVFIDTIKDTFEDEIADTIIRCLDLAAHNNIDIEAHIKAKIRYNKTRPFKHGKKY